MNTTDARQLAEQLLHQHVTDSSWKFDFLSGKSHAGLCSYVKKTIFLNFDYTGYVNEKEAKDTILHEIAHVIAGSAAGHNWEWKRVCIRIGANPSRLIDTDEGNEAMRKVAILNSRFRATCPSCSHTYYRVKRVRVGSTYCCAHCRAPKENRTLTWVRTI